jgi:hypothetical protein
VVVASYICVGGVGMGVYMCMYSLTWSPWYCFIIFSLSLSFSHTGALECSSTYTHIGLSIVAHGNAGRSLVADWCRTDGACYVKVSCWSGLTTSPAVAIAAMEIITPKACLTQRDKVE